MNNNSSSSLGLFDVLGVVFIVLKLVGVIDWTWWWVLSPFWIEFVIVLIANTIIYLLKQGK